MNFTGAQKRIRVHYGEILQEDATKWSRVSQLLAIYANAMELPTKNSGKIEKFFGNCIVYFQKGLQQVLANGTQAAFTDFLIETDFLNDSLNTIFRMPQPKDPRVEKDNRRIPATKDNQWRKAVTQCFMRDIREKVKKLDKNRNDNEPFISEALMSAVKEYGSEEDQRTLNYSSAYRMF